MLIVSKFKRIFNSEDKKTYLISEDTGKLRCPVCGGELRHRDWIARRVRTGGENSKKYMIERRKCFHCKKLHRILPDIMVPNKHYSSEIIGGVIDGTISPETETYEDYPCEMTMERWKQWFIANKTNIEGHLMNIRRELERLGDEFLKNGESLFEEMRKEEAWFQSMLRYIYNTGRWLMPQI